MIINIILGLIGLGIVVFIHELGHFLAARLAKIDVEAFSIGWGNPILKKKIGNVEYRLGMFPVGGYCKMKGDSDYNKVWDDLNNGIQPEKGSYHAASPIKRIFVCFAGPFFNFLFAVFLLSMLWGFGFEVTTLGNKIILQSEIQPGEIYPADDAGIKTGDRIIEINGRNISFYHEIQEVIALNPNKPLLIKLERDEEILELTVIPTLEKSSGAGRIGINIWMDPLIESVMEDGPAAIAGLQAGDVIISANGETLRNHFDLFKVREQNPEILVLEYERDGVIGQVQFNSEEIEDQLGIAWAPIYYRTPRLSIPAAVVTGTKESFKKLAVTVKSLRLLFMGIDLTKAVSGPVRITYMMGEMAAQSIQHGAGAALRSIAEFLALISIALCVMNLLPLPIIDGGMILLYLVEIVRKKPAHPRAISIFQTCGIVIIGALMVFALFGDILFFINR